METDEDRRQHDNLRSRKSYERRDDTEDGDDTYIEDARREKDRSRESGKHKSSDRKKDRHGDTDRDREREREDQGNDKDRVYNKDRRREQRDERERDREDQENEDWISSKERKKEQRDERERGRSRGNRGDSVEKSHAKDKPREKERDKDRDADRRSVEREYEHTKERVKERVRDRDYEKERVSSRDYERGKDRGNDRGRERERERDHDRGRGREREERERPKDYERENDKVKDRDKGRDRGKDRERDKREKDREKYKDKEKEYSREDEKSKSQSQESGKDDDSKNDDDTDRQKEADREKQTITGQNEEIQHMVGDVKDVDIPNLSYLAPSHVSASELQERIKKVKQERLRKPTDGASEIASWVNRSRQITGKRKADKEKASIRLRTLEDDSLGESDDEDQPEHTSKDLAGVKVLHGLDKVLEGGAVVLTLKDQNILADGDLNEAVDELENIEIGEQKRRDQAYKAAKKFGTYEDKFDNDLESQKSILPQYDAPMEDQGVSLDAGGRFTGEAEKKLEELRKRIEGGSVTKIVEDLTTSGKASSDYYTSEEMLQFKKPKKRKSLRKKDKLDLDALEAEAKSAGLGSADLGSRKDSNRQSAKKQLEKTEAETRNDAYQVALDKAEEASKALRLNQTLAVNVEDDNDAVFGDDYDDLQKSLEQARRLALKKQDETSTSGPQAVALQALSKKEQIDGANSIGDQENKVVITEMEEFVLSLQLNEDTHKTAAEEDVFMDEDLDPKKMEVESKDDSNEQFEEKTVNEAETSMDVEDDIAPDETIHEVSVGKGLSGALKLLQDRGALKETVDWGGRNMDKKKSKLVGIHENEGPKEIHIERLDEFGRILTPKEAFRVLSHKFHGKGPGKMKQEKRMKQFQEELKLKQMKASDTPSLSVERMRDAQVRLKTPYLVLSGHIKPGQTSDPRSGFGTIEKDLGSLTPMLGDRKVEHFLGIKRKDDKDESGSLGFPPPKKPKS